MSTESGPAVVGNLASPWVRRVPTISGVCAAAVGVVGLLGWALDSAALTRIDPDLPAIRPNTAVGLVCAGVCAALIHRHSARARAFARLGAAFTLIIGTLTLIEYLTDTDLGIDALLFPGRHGPERPAGMSAVLLVLFALPFLTTAAGRSGWHVRVRVALCSVFLVMTGTLALEYTFRSRSVLDPDLQSGVGLMTVSGMVLLGTATATIILQESVFRWLWDDSVTGRLVWRLAPVGIFLPPILGYLRLLGEDAGWYDYDTGLALYAGGLVVTFITVLAVTARTIHGSEVERSRVTQRFRALLDSAPDATVIVDRTGTITYANSRVTELLGYDVDELVGQRVEILVPEDVRRYHESLRNGFVKHPSPRPMAGNLNLAARHKDGHSVPVEISLGPLRTDDGVLTSAAIRDVSAKRDAAESLAAAEQLFRSSFDDAPIGMALLGVEGEIQQANQALADLVGEKRADLVGASIFDLVYPNDLEMFHSSISGLMDGRVDHVGLDLRVLTAQFEAHEADLRANLLRDDNGAPRLLLVQLQDVTERKRFEEQLQHMADHDPLTGLFNRRKFQSELSEHVARCNRYGAEGALISLDIDHFKQVNDTLGHNVGDQLIVAVANVLHSRLRETDVLARLGGDEFAVLLPRATKADATRVANSLVEAVRTHTGLLGDRSQTVTISAGVAMFDRQRRSDLTGDEVMIESDVALYEAKEAGRDTCAFYTEPGSPMDHSHPRISWTRRIEDALADDRFALAAQPILDLGTGVTRQYELLLRMLDEQRHELPPNAFLHIAERYGLVPQLDEWVFHKAVDLMLLRPELTIEINLGSQSLGDAQLLATITDRLATSPVNPAHLVFEVSESTALSNIAQAQAFAHTLRDLGCRFALDDFGAGFGSFYYLKHLPFDYVKIDGEFVQRAVSNRMDQLIVASVVRIAHELEKKTIAEFVTNDATLQLVTELGVDYAQGFGIGMPVPVAELTKGIAPPALR